MNKNQLIIIVLSIINGIFAFKLLHNFKFTEQENITNNHHTETQNLLIKNSKDFKELGNVTIEKNNLTIQTHTPLTETAKTIYFELKKTHIPIQKITLHPKKNTVILSYKNND